MNRDPRNIHLLAQLSGHNPFKERTAPLIVAIGTAFDQDVEAIGQDRRLSQQGKRDKAKERAQEALRALDDAQKPLADYRRQTASLRSGMKTLSFDRTDVV